MYVHARAHTHSRRSFLFSLINDEAHTLITTLPPEYTLVRLQPEYPVFTATVPCSVVVRARSHKKNQNKLLADGFLVVFLTVYFPTEQKKGERSSLFEGIENVCILFRRSQSKSFIT